jgi:hypothetical protein
LGIRVLPYGSESSDLGYEDVSLSDMVFLLLFSSLFFGEWNYGLNSGLCAVKAGALPFEPHVQSVLLWLF